MRTIRTQGHLVGRLRHDAFAGLRGAGPKRRRSGHRRSGHVDYIYRLRWFELSEIVKPMPRGTRLGGSCIHVVPTHFWGIWYRSLGSLLPVSARRRLAHLLGPSGHLFKVVPKANVAGAAGGG